MTNIKTSIKKTSPRYNYNVRPISDDAFAQVCAGIQRLGDAVTEFRQKNDYSNTGMLNLLNQDYFSDAHAISRIANLTSDAQRLPNIGQLFELRRAFPDDFDLNAIADGTHPRGLQDLTDTELISRQEQITAELLRRLNAK